MFALRGIAVSLTFFVLLYGVLSALVAVTWRSLKLLHSTHRRLAALLFALRVLPLAAAVAITLVFVVPSFQLLEPHSIDEGMGGVPLALGTCAFGLIIYGCFRVASARTKTSRVVARWLEGSRRVKVNVNVDAPAQKTAQTVRFRSQRDAPPLTLVGLRRPTVLISEATIALLSSDELAVALKHELAHMQSHDNLKKLVCRFCPFPGMAKLESAWSHAAELAADDRAVAKLDDAIDLAAALVKLSRLLPVQPAPVCTVGFVTGSISARVARLLAWNEADRGRDQRTRIRAWYAVPAALVALLGVFLTYGSVLAQTHEVTEWLVR